MYMRFEELYTVALCHWYNCYTIVTSLEARASLYYTASLASLERLERGAAQKEPSVRLLQAAGNTPTMAEMEKMKEAANFFLACQKMHQGLNGEALEAFKAIKTPYSSFYTGEIYKKMALEEKASIGVHDNGGQVRELLVESREAFYLTLDRIRGIGGASHPLDGQLAEHMEDVETMLKNEDAGAEGGDEVATPCLDTPKKYDMASRRLLSQLTSTPQGHRSLFVGNLNGGQAQPRETGRADAPPDRGAQQDHQPGINNNSIHSCSFLINIFPFFIILRGQLAKLETQANSPKLFLPLKRFLTATPRSLAS